MEVAFREPQRHTVIATVAPSQRFANFRVMLGTFMTVKIGSEVFILLATEGIINFNCHQWKLISQSLRDG